MKHMCAFVVMLSVIGAATGLAAQQTPQPSGGAPGARGRGAAPAQPPEVNGKWSGTWSAFNPAQATAQPKELCKQLDADIEPSGDIWKATFTGDCGRPYKYSIVMEGRLVGGVVMFKGTSDLGPQDGGVYDWIGRATGDQFVGFFTSSFYTGVFSLSRPKTP